MKQNHGIEYGFFRTDGKREFIEAAFCLECNTNNVVFDISFDAMIKALEK
jgi:NOL1/NOP2/fmu family ribosome biogenesis protein